MNGLIGHSSVREKLHFQIEKNVLSHALLFIGPEGIGKQKLALVLAQEVLCESTSEEKPCGVCGSCVRVLKQAHEALKIVKPEKNQIRLDEAKDVMDFLALRTWRGKRVVIIDDAHLLNPQAANALLKSIEEPPQGTYFFLTAPSSKHVMTTIRSRCQIVRLASLNVEELKQLSPRHPEWMYQASLGSADRLRQLTQREEQEFRKLAVDIVQKLMTEPQAYLLEELKEPLKDRSVLKQVIFNFSLLIRDALIVQSQGEGDLASLANPDQIETVRALAQWDSEQLYRAFQLSADLDQGITGNRDAQLLFEEFWIKIRP